MLKAELSGPEGYMHTQAYTVRREAARLLTMTCTSVATL